MTGWRKVALFVGVEAVMTWAWALAWQGMDAGTWIGATQVFFGLFIIGNGLEHSPKLAEAVGKLRRRRK